MQELIELEKYCIGTAESEEAFIDEVFVNIDQFESLLNMTPGSPKILLGNKGTGKTIVLKRIATMSESIGTDALYLVPSDIVGQKTPASEEPAVLKSFYYDALVRSTAIHLGKKMSNLLNGDDALLFNAAIEAGDKDRDHVQKFMEFLCKTGSILSGKDLSKLQPDFSSVGNRLLRAVEKNLSTKGTFLILIDEPDDIAIEGGKVSRLWGLLAACRSYCQTLKNARCIISMRTEIWHLLCQDKTGNKNIDHYQPLICNLTPSDEEIRSIIKKRLEFVQSRCQIRNEDPYVTFFEGDSTQLPPPARESKSFWGDYLVKQSRSRPRDPVQYMRLLAQNAIKNKRSKISSSDVQACAYNFSKSRIDSLIAEYQDDFCDSIYALNRLVDFEYSATDLKKTLKSILAERPRIIRGKRLLSTLDQDIFTLWAILYEMGFINQWVADDRQPLGYRHILYDECIGFVSSSNWNEMQKVRWDVHPVFRSYLYSLVDSEIHRQRLIAENKRNNPENLNRKRSKRK